jgi:hypothetical protein
LYFLESGQKRVLTTLNPLFLGLFVMALILFRTTAEPTMPEVFRRWDSLLAVMIYCGQRRGMKEGLLLVLFLTHLFSLSSVAPIGVFAIYYLIIFLAARLLSYAIYAETGISVLWMLAAFSLLSRIILPLVAAAFDHGWPIFGLENWRFLSLIFNTIVGLVVYWLLSILDTITFKAPPSNIEMNEA